MNTEIKNKVEELESIQSKVRRLKSKEKDINSSLYGECMDLLREVSEHEEINGIEYLNSCEIKNGFIYYSGEDRFRGESDYYNFDLDSNMLFDENEKNAYINELIAEKEEEEAKRKSLIEENQKNKEKKDREDYERLKKQFENQ